MLELAGVFPALVTPFGGDGQVSVADVKHNIARYNRTALAGYVAIGSTGESVLLRDREIDDVLAAVKEVAAPGKILIAGTGSESTAETIERCKRAAELGYDAALVKTPYYYKPAYKPEVLIAHYRRVADASPIPVMLYSVPIFTGLALETKETLTLAEHPNIVGIKESSGNIQRISEMIAGGPKNFQILVGSAPTIYASFAVGARGAILALADALPEKCAQVYEYFSQGRHQQALELQRLLIGASKLIVSDMGISGIKYAMDLRGFRGGLPRLPLPPLSDEQKARLNKFLSTIEQPVLASA